MTNRINVTKTLIWVNVIVYLMMVGYGGLATALSGDVRTALVFGANYGPLTESGQYWRLITCMFVHFGILHIGMNMWCLWQLGQLSEALFGRWKYLTVYFIAGIGASLSSLYFHPSVPCAGASGAIFGLCGALLAVLLLDRDRFIPAARSSLLSNLLFFVVLNVALGSAIPGIDMSAHIGGLVTGFIAAAGITKFMK